MPQSAPRPNLFVVGDAKCGTSTLHQLFARTPNVGTTWRKEFHFFSAPELVRRVAGPGDDRIPHAIVQDEATYLSEFAMLKAPPPVVADVSPSYLRIAPAAARIKAFAPQAKIVITLREPAAKVFSQYVHLWSEGRETLPFEEAYALSAERQARGFSDMFDYEGGGYYTPRCGATWSSSRPSRCMSFSSRIWSGRPRPRSRGWRPSSGWSCPRGPCPMPTWAGG